MIYYHKLSCFVLLLFFQIPGQETGALEKWKLAMKRQGEDRKLCSPGSGSTVCSDHFKDSDYQVTPGADRKLLSQLSIASSGML